MHTLQLCTEFAEMPPTPRAKARLAGNSKRLLTVAMADASTQFVRPSLLAAAALAVDRKSRGLVPVWPASLRRWTGIAGPEDPALDAAMQVRSCKTYLAEPRCSHASWPGLVKYQLASGACTQRLHPWFLVVLSRGVPRLGFRAQGLRGRCGHFRHGEGDGA